MKKKTLFMIGSTLAVLFIIIFLIAGRSTHPADLAKQFKEKVESGDANGLVKLVKLQREDMSWDKKDAEAIIDYLKSENKEFQNQIELLEVQANYYVPDGEKSIETTIAENFFGEAIMSMGPFFIDKEKGLFGRDTYTLKARAYKVEVEATKGAEIEFKGEKINLDKSNSKFLGYFGPGVYEIKGEKKFDYTTVSDEEKFTLFDGTSFEETVTLNFSGENVNISSSVPNTEIVVNGKGTGEKIEEGTTFGPVKDGISLQGKAEFPWGESKSKEYKVKVEEDNDDDSFLGFSGSTNGYDLTPSPINNKTMKNNVKQVINDFAKQRIEAQNAKDANKLKNVSDQLKKEYIETIADYDSKNYFEGKALGTRIDFSRASYEFGSGGSHLLHIPVEFHDKTRQVYEYFDSESEEGFSEVELILEYIEDKKSWIISRVEDDYSYDEDYMTSNEVEKTSF
ncbi:TcaA 3rd/4th domain-containing protein [Bacillus sp. 179-C3.3 HS]|uniref:TcaA 3rd/4th domain-containing protein n=1 Tax=Bacillus sp. 179-C3.3 HS TaxID=3232162 RepID=UPI00399F6BEC